MDSTRGLILDATGHFIKQAREKGFTADAIIDTFLNPVECYPSRSHPGQYRLTGNGICIVGKPVGAHFVAITIYEDRVVTPVRPDQLDTPEGRRFAEVGRQ